MSARLQPAATFTAARHELIGPDALLGPAEIARSVCRRATRRLGLLAVTDDRMRRIDGWLADDAIVTHPVAPSPDHPVIGTVCAREHGDDLVGSIIEALVGPMPSSAASDGLPIDGIGGLAPGSLPDGVGWVLVVTSITAESTEHWAVAASDGLVGAMVFDPRSAVRLDPIGPLPNWARIARLLGSPVSAASSGAERGGVAR